MRFRKPNLTGLILATLAVSSAYAQVESNLPEAGFGPSPSTAPTIVVYSQEIVIDVLVTDDNGRPVRGLKRSDFAVQEDGHRQPIRSFSEYDRNPAIPQPAALPPNTYSNAHILPADGPVQIFYFELPVPSGSDPSLSQGAVLVRAKKYIADYFRTMPGGTQVAIFSYVADRGLQLVQSFTTDGALAASALDNMVVQRFGKAPSADPIAAADQIAAYVAGIRGRKNLIWVGTPLAIVRDGGMSWSIKNAPDMTYVHRLMDTYDLFTREQIAVYPFDPRGVSGLGWSELRVEDIASQTGGKAIYNTNDFKGAVAKIVDETSRYYTLSYIPPRATNDGHYHTIKIIANRPGLHLQHRGGYNSEQPALPDSVLNIHMTQDTMGLGALPATQLIFDAAITPSKPDPPDIATRRVLPVPGKPISSYDTLFTLQPTQIAFAQNADRMYSGAIEFDLAAYDAYGKVLTTRSQTLKLTLTPEEYHQFMQTPFKFFLPVGLPPGSLTLCLGIFDTVSGKAGTLQIPLTVSTDLSHRQ